MKQISQSQGSHNFRILSPDLRNHIETQKVEIAESKEKVYKNKKDEIEKVPKMSSDQTIFWRGINDDKYVFKNNHFYFFIA